MKTAPERGLSLSYTFSLTRGKETALAQVIATHLSVCNACRLVRFKYKLLVHA